ncbi:MAG: amidohydrolase family protein [Oscillospiraceae bacterium]|nr:amidohydrolase family protein [Oscillospiraceae bacterium]
MPPKARVVLYGGHVVDPANGIDEDRNVIMEDGRIAALTRGPYVSAGYENAVDVSGCIVTPGLIDHHCHMYPLAEKIGIPADSVMFGSGVTSIVDAGSCGAANYPAHRSFKARTRMTYKAYIHVCPLGLNETDIPDPEKLDYGLLAELFAECGEELMGLKLRISRNLTEEWGFAPLKKTVEIADKLGVPLMVHPTDPPGEMEELLSFLRPGDVCSHMYMNIGSGITDEAGHVKPCVLRARERGVLFEAADAQAHFGLSTAQAAIREGFLPDFIATDGTVNSMFKRPTAFSLAMQLARYESLGLSFPEILRRCTVNPARDMGLTDGEGTLTVGKTGDAAVFRRHEREVLFGDRPNGDPDQRTWRGQAVYEPVLTVKRGMVVYRNILL